ncbi:MAG: type 4a pilus biogenesis protein PilO [Actinomycetota bacterium]
MNISVDAIDRVSGRTALVVAAAAVLLVVLVGWFALVAPKRAKAAELETKTTDAQTQLIDTQRFLDSSAGRKSARDLEKLLRAVPADPRMAEILRQLTQAARAAGVTIDGVTPAAMASTAGAQAIPMTVIAEGHYFRLQKFIHLLRAAAVVSSDSIHVSGRLLAVDSIDFSSAAASSTDGGTKGLITATLAVDGFVATTQAAAGQTGAAGSLPSTSGSTPTTSP